LFEDLPNSVQPVLLSVGVAILRLEVILLLDVLILPQLTLNKPVFLALKEF
jgi:hypothetical protein